MDGFSRLYCSMRVSTSGVATRGLEPPITPGLMDPVSLKETNRGKHLRIMHGYRILDFNWNYSLISRMPHFPQFKHTHLCSGVVENKYAVFIVVVIELKFYDLKWHYVTVN